MEPPPHSCIAKGPRWGSEANPLRCRSWIEDQRGKNPQAASTWNDIDGRKSCSPVDTLVYPIIYKALYIPTFCLAGQYFIDSMNGRWIWGENVIRCSGVCLDPFLAFHQTFRGKNGDMERENYTDQVLPKGSRFSPSQKGHKLTKNCQGMISNAVGPGKKHIKIPAGRGGLYADCTVRKSQQETPRVIKINMDNGKHKGWTLKELVWNGLESVSSC